MNQTLAQKKILEVSHQYENVIWDWNGTLIDDAGVAAKANSKLLAEYGMAPISEQEYRARFCYPLTTYYENLGFDLQHVSFREIGDRFIHWYQHFVVDASLFEGMHEILQVHKENGQRQAILSAATEESILKFLEHFAIANYFQHVFGLSDHYQINKLRRGEELMQETGWDPAKTLLIGDTDHDKETSERLGIHLLLVADGHQEFERLSKVHDLVIESRF